MTLPDFNRLPEEEPSHQNGSTDQPQPDHLVRAAPRRVVHGPMATRRPVEEERKPASIFQRFSKTRKTAAEPGRQSEAETSLPASEGWEAFPGFSVDANDVNPGQKLRGFEDAGRDAPKRKIPLQYRLKPDREMTRRAFWDIAGGMSLLINAILVGALLIMAVRMRELKDTMNYLLQGLYGNFVEMDAASIATTITVDAQIPLNFVLPVQQNTTVQLTQAVRIPGTQVEIDTGPITIDAPARVTLPAGTLLPISLTMDIPVQAVIPISLQVPVNIPLNQTQLHGPFEGLQNTIKPLYCTFNQNAQYPAGVFICDGHDAPTPVPGLP